MTAHCAANRFPSNKKEELLEPSWRAESQEPSSFTTLESKLLAPELVQPRRGGAETHLIESMNCEDATMSCTDGLPRNVARSDLLQPRCVVSPQQQSQQAVLPNPALRCVAVLLLGVLWERSSLDHDEELDRAQIAAGAPVPPRPFTGQFSST